MDELSPLFQDIEFRERLRGYDVEEVDAYIDRVARAAALVQGRIAELQQRAEAAEAREAPRAAAPVESEETMSRMLLLAQRTADAAVAEAQAEASEVLARAHADAAATRADADEYASRVLAEAETDRRRAITDAESAAAEAIAHERERVADAIAELEHYRSFLAEDIDILERHLADSRSALAASLSGLTDLLEAPEAFRAPAMPATSGAMAPAALETLEDEEAVIDLVAEERAEAADEAPTHTVVDADPQPVEAVEVPVEMVEMVKAPEEADLAQPVFAPAEPPVADEWAAPAEAIEHAVAEIDVADPVTEPVAILDLPEPEPEPVVDFVVPEAAVDTTPESHDIDLTAAPIDLAPASEPQRIEPPLLVTAADLEASESGDEWVRDLHVESGPITEPVPMVADQLLFEEPPTESQATAADPFLEQLRDAVARDDAEEFGDDALAAFFDSENDDGGRSWFPKRR